MAILDYPGLQKYDAELKSFVEHHYRRQLKFAETPIYSVTLAEDWPLTDNPFILTTEVLGGPVAALWIQVTSTSHTSANLGCSAAYGTGGNSVPNTLRTNTSYSVSFFGRDNGMLYSWVSAGSGENIGKAVYSSMHTPIFSDELYTEVTIGAGSTESIKAGTIITIYVAQEA